MIKEMKNFTKKQVYDVFESVFKEKVEEDRMLPLVEYFGLDAILEGLTYISIKGLRPIPPGRRNNPYGLIFRVCKKGKDININ